MRASVTVSTRSTLMAKTALCGVAGGVMLAAAHPAAADPLSGYTGSLGTVTGVQQSGASPPAATIAKAGSAYTLTPNASRTIIDWSTFTVPTGESLNFAFAANSDIAVNRLPAMTSATVNGTLTSMVGASTGGNVWILAPGGVLFGNNSVTTVGGLLATTANLATTDTNFLKTTTTSFSFTGADKLSTVSVTKAQITATGDTLALIAPTVSVDSTSQVTANAGTALFGAAANYTVKFDTSAGDLDLVSFQVDADTLAGTVSLLGPVNAGNVWVAALNPTATAGSVISLGGLVTATKAAGVNGDIILSGGGKIDAGGAGAVAGAGKGDISISTAPSVGGRLGIATPGAVVSTVDLESAGDVIVSGGTLTVKAIKADTGDLTLTTTGGALVAGALTAAGNVQATAATALTTGDVTAGGAKLDALAGKGLIGKLKTTGDAEASATDTLTLAAVDVGGALTLTSVNKVVDVTGSFAVTGKVTINSFDLPTFAGFTSLLSGTNKDIVLNLLTTADTTFATKLDAGTGTISITTAGNLKTAELDGLGVKAVSTGGSLTVGDVNGGAAAVTLGAATTINAGKLTGTGVSTTSGGTLTVAAIDGKTGLVNLKTTGGGDISASSTITGTGVTANSGGKIGVTGKIDGGTGAVSLTAKGDIGVDALNGVGVSATSTAGGLTTKDVTANAGNVSLGAVTDLTTGKLSGANVSATTTTGLLTVDTVNAGAGTVVLGSGKSFGNADITGGNVELDVTAGDLAIAGSSLHVGGGAGTLTLKVSGAATQTSALTLGALTGQAGSLALTDPGNAIGTLTALKTTTGALSVVNGADLTVSGGLGSAGTATVNVGAHKLSVSGAIDTTGLATFTAGAIDVGAGITTATTGGITFAGPVGLSATTAISTGGALTFTKAIDGLQDLTLKGSVVSFGAAVGGGTPLNSLQVTGPVALSDVTTKGDQTYAAATISGGTTLTSNNGGTIKFTGGVDTASGAAQQLTVSTTGAASFGGAVGAADGLSGLAVKAGTVSFGATNGKVGGLAIALTQAGGVDYKASGDVTVSTVNAVAGVSTKDSDIALQSTGGKLVVAADVNAGKGSASLTAAGTVTQTGGVITADTLKVSATGGIDIEGPGDAFAKLGPVTNAGTGTVKITDGQAFTVTGPIKNNASGAADISLNAAAGFTVSSDIIAGGAGALTLGDVTLGGDATLSAGGMLTIGKLDGGYNATLGSGTQGALTGAIGSSQALASLTVNGPMLFSGATVKTSGAQTFNGPLALGADTTLTTTGASDITVHAVDSDAVGTPRALSFITNGGSATFLGAVGGAAPLQSVTTNGKATFGGSVVTKAGQTYGGAVTLSGNSGLKSAGGLIKLSSTLDSQGSTPFALVADAGAGDVQLLGAIGGAHALAGLGVKANTLTDGVGGTTFSTTTNSFAANIGSGGVTISNAGSLTIGTVSGGGLSVTGLTTQGANATLKTTSGDLHLNQATNLSAAALKLTSAGLIDQTASGAITAGSLAASAVGDITLGAQNLVPTVSLAGAGLSYTSGLAGETDFLSVDGSNGASLTTGGDLKFTGTATAHAAQLTLKSNSGAVVQAAGATLTAGKLSATAAGAVTLNENNDVTEVASLASTGGGALGFTDGHAATVTLDAIGNGLSDATINLAKGAVLAGPVNEAGHVFKVSAGGAIDGQTATVTAGTLTVASLGGLDLSGPSNAIAKLGDVTNTGGGAVKISTVGDLVSDVGTTLKSVGGDVALNATGKVALSGALTAAGQTLDVQAAQVATTGVITASTLTGKVTNDASFTGANLVDHIGTFTAGSMSFTSGQGIDVSGALGVTGVLSLDAVGAVTQSTGTVGAGSLAVTEAASVNLPGANAIPVINGIAVTTGGAVTVATGGDLELASAIQGVGATAAGAVRLDSGGAITHDDPAGIIRAASFTGSSKGSADLSGGNHVGELKGFTSGGKFDFGDLDPLTVSGPVAGDGTSPLYLHGDAGLTLTSTVNAGTGALTIESKNGAIAADGATLTAASLTGSAALGASFGNAANAVPVLAGFTTNTAGPIPAQTFALTTKGALDVTGVVATNGGGLKLTAGGGDLTLDNSLAAGAGTVSLSAAGQVTQTLPFTITAAKLDAAANGGPLSLKSANLVGDLTALKGTQIDVLDSIADPAPAVRLGDVTTTGNVNVTADQGSLSLYKGWSTTGDVTLKAAGQLESELVTPFTITGNHVLLEAASLAFATGSATATAGATAVSGPYKDVDALQIIADTGSLSFGAASAPGGTVKATTPGDLTLGTVTADIANLDASSGKLSVGVSPTIGTTYNIKFLTYDAASAALAPIFGGAPSPDTQLFHIQSTDAVNGFSYSSISAPHRLEIVTAGALGAGTTTAKDQVDFNVIGATTLNGVVKTTSGAGSTVNLLSTGAIAEAGAGAIVTDKLTAEATGGIKLDGAGNLVPTLDSLTNHTSGAIVVNDAASSVTLNTLSAAGDVAIAATNGSLTLATAIATPASTTFGAITQLKGSDINSSGPLKLSGGSISFTGTVQGASAEVSASGDAAFATLQTGGTLNVTTGGAFTAALAQGGSTTIKSGSVNVQTLNGGSKTTAQVTGLFKVGTFSTGDAVINAGSLSVDSTNATGSVTAQAGDTHFGVLLAGAAVKLNTGALTFDTASSGTTFDATSISIKGGELDAGGALTATATGPITLDTVKAGSTASLTAAAITVTGPFTSKGTATFKAGGALTLASAKSDTDLVATAASFTGDTATAAGSLTATITGLTKANTLEATKGSVLVKTGSFDVGVATAGQDATFNATGAGKLDTLTAGHDGSLTAASLTLGDATAGHDLTIKTGALTANSLTATAGDLTVGAATATVKTSAAGGAAKLTTTSDATYGDLSTGGDATVIAGGNLGLSTAEVGGDLVIQSLGLTSDTLKAAGKGTITATGATIGALTTGADATVTTTGDATIGDLASGASSTLSIGGALTLTTAEIGTDLVVKAGSFNAGVVDAQEDASFTASAPSTIATLTAGRDAGFTTGDLTVGDATAGRNLTLASGALTANSLTATGGDLGVKASTADVVTSHAGDAATLGTTGAATYGDLSTGGDATVTAGGNLALKTAEIGADLVATAASFTGDTATAAGSLTATITGLTKANTLEATKGNVLVKTGSFDVGVATAGQDATFTATGAGKLDTLTAGHDGSLTAASLTLGDATAGHDLTIKTGALTANSLTATAGDLTVGAATATVKTSAAGGAAKLTTTSDATYGDLSTGGDATVIAGGNLGLSTAEVGGDLVIQSLGLTSDTLKAAGKGTVTATGATIGALTTGADATVTTTGDATIGDLASGASSTLSIGGAATLGTADVKGALTASAASLTATGALTSGGASLITTTAGDLALNTLTAGADATLTSAGNLGFNTVTAAGAITGQAATVSGGALTAGTTLGLTSSGSAVLTSAQSGGALAVSAADLMADSVTAGGKAAITTAVGDATIGALKVADDLALNAAGAARVGSLASTGAASTLTILGVDVTLGAAAGALPGGANTLTLNAAAPGALTLTASRDATVNLTGPGRFANITAGRTLSASTQGGDLAVTTVQGGDAISLVSDGSVLARSTTLGPAGRSVSVNAGQDVVLGSPAGGAGPSQVVAPAGATLTFVAGRDVTAGLDTGFTANSVTAGRDIALTSATGDVSIATALAGRKLAVTASAGKATLGAATTTGVAGAAGSDVSVFGTSLQVSTVNAAGGLSGVASTGDAVVSNATVGGDLSLSASKGLASLNTTTVTGAVPGVRVVKLAGASAALGRTVAGAAPATLTVADPANTVVLVQAAAGPATVDLAGDVRLTRVDATGAATVTTGGALTLGDTAGIAGGATIGGAASFTSGGAMTVANVTSAGDATLTSGAALSGANLNSTGGSVQLMAAGPLVLSGANALSDVIGTAGAGPLSTSGTVSAGRNLTLTATSGDATLGGVASAGTKAVLDTSGLATIDTLKAPDVRVLARDLTLKTQLGQAGATIAVESRTGGLTVGGTTAGTGLTLDNAEAGKVVGDALNVYAGSTTGTARGDATVNDLLINAGSIKSIAVLAGAGNKVTVAGAVTTSADGAGAFAVGRAPSDTGVVDPWTPQDVTVTGNIGQATAAGTRSFSNVKAVGAVSLNARDDILIGTPAFVTAIGTNPGANIDITKQVPAGVTTLPADINRIFLTAGTLSLSGAGRIVQQSTGIQQMPVGVYLTNPGKSGSALRLSGLGTGSQPSVIDLSLSFFDGSGTLLSEQIAASSPSIGLGGGLERSNSYRVNGCAIGASQQCTPTTSTVVDVRPEKLVQSLVLTQTESPVQADPTITGAGNEEIWRNAPISSADDSDERRAKSTGSPATPADAAPPPPAAPSAAPPPPPEA